MPEDFAIGLYRRTTAHWHNGKVTTLFVKQSGQGSKLVLEQSNETTVTLGGEFTLQLTPIEGAEPPIITIPPEFPELPTPEVPIKPEAPIYKPPGGVTPEMPPGIEPPIYEKPPEGVMPELPPGKEPPMYEKPVKPEPPIYEKPGETKPAPEPGKPEPK